MIIQVKINNYLIPLLKKSQFKQGESENQGTHI